MVLLHCGDAEMSPRLLSVGIACCLGFTWSYGTDVLGTAQQHSIRRVKRGVIADSFG